MLIRPRRNRYLRASRNNIEFKGRRDFRLAGLMLTGLLAGAGMAITRGTVVENV